MVWVSQVSPTFSKDSAWDVDGVDFQGAAVATLGISQNQKSGQNQTRSGWASFIRLPILANTVMMFIPFAVTVTIFTTFILANVHCQRFQRLMLVVFQEVGKFPSNTTCTPLGLLSPIPSQSLSSLIPLLEKTSSLFLKFKLHMRLGFACWTLANLTNLVIWGPCFVWQFQILTTQYALEKAVRRQRQQLKSISPPMANPDFCPRIQTYYSDRRSHDSSRHYPSRNPSSSYEDTYHSTGRSSMAGVDMRRACELRMFRVLPSRTM